ncbi:hypothetical protein COY17_04350 [Candidatus Saccharibacteria bacterium CG_4_10_14_0_2_um_filter_52_9]|nr:MAG: hypothetical protein COY17_04350 [Candidatus Saccharibacteria bacterium CG_4_10_14_0_2_um_filter_52_9]
MQNTNSEKIFLYLPLLLWVVYFVAWLCINVFHLSLSKDDYSDSYSLIALTTGIAGLVSAKKWGLFKSRFGATISYISVGLLLQFIGHFIYALYFRVGHVTLAYPSVGDVPFLLTGLAYTLAIYYLLKVIVVKGSIFRPGYVLVAGTVSTLLVMALVYFSFLHLGMHDERGVIYSLLNVAYPVLQVSYFLLGLVALIQAKRMAGGKMFTAVLALLAALILQYVADFSFLYQDYHNTWQAAGTNDFVYVMAYGLMALSILMIENVRVNALRTPIPNSNDGAV